MALEFGKINLGNNKFAYYYPTDETMKEETGGKYFVTYAEETKIEIFTNKRDAEWFIKRLKDQLKINKSPYQFAYGTVWATSKEEALKELDRIMTEDRKR